MVRAVLVVLLSIFVLLTSFSARADVQGGVLNTGSVVLPYGNGGVLLGDLGSMYLGDTLSGSNYNITLTFDDFPYGNYATAIAFTTDPNGAIVEYPDPFLAGAANAYATDPNSVGGYMANNLDGFQYGFAMLPPGESDLNQIRYNEDRGPITFQSGTPYYALVGMIGGPFLNSSGAVNVQYSLNVSPVPEAETWVMMLLGLAGIGAWFKRKQARIGKLAAA